jgi:hypothetical protein
LGKPLDGWSAGHGVTGNHAQEDGVLNNNAPELTGNQLFEAVLCLEKQLKQRCGMDRTSKAEDISNAEVQQRSEKSNTGSEKSSLNPPQRRRAVEFFEYHTEVSDVKEVDARPSGRSAPATEVDDGLVYSRVHGYRIKIDHHEDTSLAYKKVLGDIKVRRELSGSC